MARLQLNLPERVRAAARKRAAAGGYRSVDHYITTLIQADGVAPINDEMEAELIKGLGSGPAVDLTSEFLAALKRRARTGRGNAA